MASMPCTYTGEHDPPMLCTNAGNRISEWNI